MNSPWSDLSSGSGWMTIPQISPMAEDGIRIVSWNLARRGKKTLDFLLGLEPDIALIQEAILPVRIDGYEVASTKAWEGKAWESAVMSRHGEPEVVWENSDRGAVLLTRCSIPLLGTILV